MPFSLFANSLSSQVKIPVKEYKLKNGLKVLLNINPQTTISSYYLGFATGSRHEKKGITGISHMFEHLMFRGTKKYPDIPKLYSQNGMVGMNAYTSKDYTAYISQFPPEKLELVLDVESDRMSRLTLTQSDLDKERQAVQEERRLRVDNNPRGMLWEALFETVFKIHSYRWPVLGYKKDIDSYTLKDLNNWYETYYSPNNATLVLSGSFSESEARRLVQKYFGPLVAKKIPEEKILAEPPQTETRSYSIQKPIQTKHAVLVYPFSKKINKEALALDVACDILGTGESSHLYKIFVRERKMVSQISCFAWNLNQKGLFFINYALLSESSETEVKDAIYNEIHKMISKEISKKEIEKAKNIKLMGFISELKRSSSRAQLLGLYEVNFDGYKNIYKDLDGLSSLSSDFIQSTMKKYLNPNQSSYLILKPEKNK